MPSEAGAHTTQAIVIEAKGGSSQCGSRKDPFNGGRVTQGTAEYAEVIARVMTQCTSNPARRAVGIAFNHVIGQSPSKAFYFGTRTKYDKYKGVVCDPVPIFAEEL